MTVEQFANFAEIIGVILVIASLVYVAQQLRQNTDMMRVSASNERVRRDFEIVANLLDSRNLAEGWVKGGKQFDALDEVDQQRAIFFEYRAISVWHHEFQLRQQNLTLDANWHSNEWLIQNIGRRQAVREAWVIFKKSYEKPFQEYIDRQFEIADGTVSGD
jgi:hypothetical protein